MSRQFALIAAVLYVWLCPIQAQEQIEVDLGAFKLVSHEKVSPVSGEIRGRFQVQWKDGRTVDLQIPAFLVPAELPAMLHLRGDSRLIVDAWRQGYVVNPQTGEIVDSFSLMSLSVSPDGRYLAGLRPVPNGTVDVPSIYLIYDVDQAPEQNKTPPFCILPPSAEDAFVWPHFLFIGVPLCVSSLLLAAVHAQHRLDDPRDRTTALVWAFGVFLIALPAPAWEAAFGRYDAVLWVQPTAVALAAVFLVSLAERVWAQRPRMPLFLSGGIVALALIFARVAYQMVSGIMVGYTHGYTTRRPL